MQFTECGLTKANCTVVSKGLQLMDRFHYETVIDDETSPRLHTSVEDGELESVLCKRMGSARSEIVTLTPTLYVGKITTRAFFLAIQAVRDST